MTMVVWFQPMYSGSGHHLIVVSPQHIKCLTYKQLAAGKAITPECNNLLIVRKDLDLDRQLIVKFGQLAGWFFVGV
jgi:hypothetical protein